MKLEYAVPCRAIDKLADGTYILLGVEANGFVLASSPQQIAVVLLTCISLPHGDNPVGRLAIQVLNPALEPCAPQMGIDLHMTASPLLPEGWSNRVLIPSQVVFVADAPGAYSIELSVGSGSLSIPLIVFQPTAPPSD